MNTQSDISDYTISLDSQHQAVIIRYSDRLPLDSITRSSKELTQLISEHPFSSKSPVSIVSDLSRLQQWPYKLTDLEVVTDFLRDDRIYFLILIVPQGMAGKIIEFLGTVVSKMSRTRFRVFSTLDEAVVFLESPSNPFYKPEEV